MAGMALSASSAMAFSIRSLEQRPIAWNRCAVPPIGHKLL
jgi:hypothetical protein